MTEDEARTWVRDNFGLDAYARIDRFATLLLEESEKQNLISRSTRGALWARHIVDSLQLIELAPKAAVGGWIDIGSGAGMPGLVVALASEWPVILIEPRKLRVEFLRTVVASAGLGQRITVLQSTVERSMLTPAAVISARAVANLTTLLEISHHLANRQTHWLLPKGASANSEVETAKAKWQGVFHVKQSLVDPASGIITATGVAPR